LHKRTILKDMIYRSVFLINHVIPEKSGSYQRMICKYTTTIMETINNTDVIPNEYNADTNFT